MSLLDLFSFKPVPFTLPNGNTVYLRPLTAGDKMAWIDEIPDSDDAEHTTAAANLDRSAKLLQKSVCHADGSLIFSNPAEVKMIDNVTIERLLERAMVVNGMGKAGADAVEKKSESGGDTPAS